MAKQFSFNDLPEAMSLLLEKVTRLESLLETKTQAPKANDDEMMDLKGLQNFHPEHPAAATIYKWVRIGQIPYYKTGKKLIFKRSCSKESVRCAPIYIWLQQRDVQDESSGVL